MSRHRIGDSDDAHMIDIVFSRALHALDVSLNDTYFTVTGIKKTKTQSVQFVDRRIFLEYVSLLNALGWPTEHSTDYLTERELRRLYKEGVGGR